MTQKLRIFDTTLRDGAQTIGINMTLDDKQRIFNILDNLGVEFIEAGFPGANTIDDMLFSDEKKISNPKLVAFGMMRHKDQSVGNDITLSSVLNSNAANFCLVGKCWDKHIFDALKIPMEEHLLIVKETIERASGKGQVFFDAEHFFDGFKADPVIAVEIVKTALSAGAHTVVLCDTNGGTLPYEIFDIVTELQEKYGLDGNELGIHTHNDTNNADANTIMAVKAGVTMVQGTLAGIGERCGNANLLSLLPTFIHKMKLNCGDITEEKLHSLTAVYEEFCDIIGIQHSNDMPYVGTNAFTTKAGLHASAQATEPAMYEHIAPENIGNQRHIRVSNQSGYSNIKAAFAELDIPLNKSNESKARDVLRIISNRQESGYSYDQAPESFELFARQQLFGNYRFFDLKQWKVSTERHRNEHGVAIAISEATVKVKINNTIFHEVEEAVGPFNAIDKALKKALTPHFPFLKNFELQDYHVDLPKQNTTTAAFTRATIKMVDHTSDAYKSECLTLGVSNNIIDASVEALLQAYRWKIMREKLKVETNLLKPT